MKGRSNACLRNFKRAVSRSRASLYLILLGAFGLDDAKFGRTMPCLVVRLLNTDGNRANEINALSAFIGLCVSIVNFRAKIIITQHKNLI